MRANSAFTNQSHEFWACVKLLSQRLGYSKKGVVIIPTEKRVKKVFSTLKLSKDKIFTKDGTTEFGKKLFSYFTFRAHILNSEVQHNLMNIDEAKALYEKVVGQYQPRSKPVYNKQKGVKKTIAYFTNIINILIEAHIGGIPTIYDPRQITAFTKDKFPARSLSRRVDGAFPQEIDPIAIWEIKEYYHTTTFGSRIADGVYETMLDGYELKDARGIVDRNVLHYLMIDSHRSWWVGGGLSYLCRIVDMLHMGLITECLVGREVETRIPGMVGEWLEMYERYKGDFTDGQMRLVMG